MQPDVTDEFDAFDDFDAADAFEACDAAAAGNAVAADAPLVDAAAAALAGALETLAFIFAEPAAGPDALSPAARLLGAAIEFDAGAGERSTLEITADAALARSLAETLLGSDAAGDEQMGRDALAELANVTCGLLLRDRDDAPAVGLPRVAVADALPTDAALFDADGMAIAVRLAA